MPAYPADVVGSLLRPEALRTARARYAAGEISREALRAAEDRAVAEAVDLQEGVGLPVATDGEYRRDVFYGHLLEAVDGFAAVPLPPGSWQAIRWRGGDPSPGAAVQAAAVARLRRRAPFAVAEFRDLKRRVRTAVPKVTLPAPSFLERYWVPDVSSAAYPTREAYVADLVDILRQEVAELVAEGATYIQFDAPNYGLAVDPTAMGGEERPLAELLAAWVEADNAVLEGFPGVTFGLHVCRGNSRGRWAAEGGYDPIAPVVFPGLRHERLLLEYDTVRAGTFEPLRHVPDKKVAVLGLVSTKTPEVEAVPDLLRRLEDARRQRPGGRFALSPQCGFASVAEGNPIPWEAQAAKLKVVVEASQALEG